MTGETPSKSNDLLTPRRAGNRSRPKTVPNLVAVFTAIVASVGAFVSYQSLDETRRQGDLAVQTQLTDRYSRTIDQLGSPSQDVRLGGLFALERIATDSDRSIDRQAITEVLIAFLFNHTASRSEPDAEPHPGYLGRSQEVEITLSILKHVSGKETVVDLGGLDLHGLDLIRVDLAGYDLHGANLDQVLLKPDSNLDGTTFKDASLKGADFTGAKAIDGDFRGAHLNGIIFDRAILRAARFDRGMTCTDMTEATLVDADLTGATVVDVIAKPEQFIQAATDSVEMGLVDQCP